MLINSDPYYNSSDSPVMANSLHENRANICMGINRLGRSPVGSGSECIF